MYNTSKQTILIVDDNPKNLQLLGNILKESDYKLEFGTNGIEALEWLEDKKFDLVLMDIMMPGMDGYEACRKIRQDEKYNDMPIIFLTAKTDKESIVEGFKAGAQDYISKPFDMNELLARVTTHLALRSSKDKLNELNSLLEEKVRERTLELENANAQLSNLDQAKTEFLNLIGHEIRTPLNGIIGPLEIIKEDLPDSKIDTMIKLMSDSVERLEKFAFEALLITNLRTGKQHINPENFIFSDLFQDLETRQSEVLSKSNTRLVDATTKPCVIEADYDLIRTCIEKLVENALLYIREDGELTLWCEFDHEIRIYMSDSRVTFTDSFLDNMDKLFEPKGKYIDSNLGIGMVLAKLILLELKGSIGMENIQEKGATVIVKFGQN